MMTDLTDETQAQFRAIAEEMKAMFFRLAGMLVALPLTPLETSREDIGEETDLITELRAVALCVKTDYLRPAVRDLLAAADFQPGEPAGTEHDFFDQFYETFREPVAVRPGEGVAEL